jgi:tetratricopeptide (TPR) repeat protein
MTRTCPACGHESSGRFCSNCGTGLDAAVACAECGNELPPGGRFCNQCGAPTAATQALLAQRAAGAKQSPLPWVLGGAGAVAVVALAVVLLSRGGDDQAAAAAPAAAPFAGSGAPAGDPSQIDLSTMTPRQQADRLYQRIMEEASAGDSARARGFLPMAFAAYQQVPDLDLDARYHLGVLHFLAGDAPSARAQADTILAAEPDHLFGLHTAASAEQALGNQAEANRLFERFLQVYDAQVATGREEYGAHAAVLDVMRQEASRAVDSL